MQTIKISPDEKLLSIAMKVKNNGDEQPPSLLGIKLHNTKFEEIVNVTWSADDSAGWVYQDIPVNHFIAGCQIGSSKGIISRLGFRLATLHSIDPTPVPDFIPKIYGDTLEFGEPQHSCNKRWDNLGAFKKPSKLIAIRYQQYDDEEGLSGVQLCFQNNVKTDMMQTPSAAEGKSEMKTIKIDPNKTIASISMKVNPDRDEISGIKMYSDDYEELCNVVWNTYRREGEWKTQIIPRGQQICGLMADTPESKIRKVGFILGTADNLTVPEAAPNGTWRPKFCRPLMFGDKSHPTHYSFPAPQELHNLNGPPKLVAIRYKQEDNNGVLSSIQICWEEFRSQFIETRRSRHQNETLKTELVKPYTRIAQISVRIGSYGKVCGLKLTDDQDEEVFDKTFYNDGKWVHTEVPEGQAICGFSVSTPDESTMTKLAFSMATVENYVKIDHSQDIPQYIVRNLKFAPGADSSYKDKWPKSQTSAEMKKITKPMKLMAVRYKHYDGDYNLSGIQLVFTNGFKTPMYLSQSSESRGEELKTIKIDSTKQISTIEMKIEDGWVRGLRLISDNQESLCDVTWCTYRDGGTWVSKDLEDHEQIIGVAVDNSIDSSYIKLAFVIGSAIPAGPSAAVNYDKSGSWRPKVCRPVSFGSEDFDFNEKSLKCAEQLYKYNEMPKLKCIKYKQRDDEDGLAAIQLIWDDNSKTPMYSTSQGEEEGWELKVIKVKPYNMITQIAMKWSDDMLSGLKFETDEMEYCVDTKWNTYNSDGAWKYTDIEDEKVICGLSVCTEDSRYIKRLGFIMASAENYEPKPPQAPDKLEEPIKFGENADFSQRSHKSDGDLSKLKGKGVAQLKAIRYKVYRDDDNLCGLQFIFNSHKTPMYQSDDGDGYELKTVQIEPNHKPVDKIQMRVYGDNRFYALRLIDSDGEMICDEWWARDKSSGKWVTKDVEDGQQLVGLATASSDADYLTTVGFIMGSTA